MSYRYSLTLLGTLMVALGVIQGGWLLLSTWLGGNFIVLGIAHAKGWHGIFGKRADGSLPPWSWLVFLPLHGLTYATWHLARLASKEPSMNKITENLWAGRRLLPLELPESFDTYVDLTAEFAEPLRVRTSFAYRCFPILDGGAPSPDILLAVIASLPVGRTFVHCAQGHGRTGLFTVVMLLHAGVVNTVDEALTVLVKARPGIRLNREQLECAQACARLINASTH